MMRHRVRLVLIVGCIGIGVALALALLVRVTRRPFPVDHTSLVRAARRAYDGAPPVIPHAPLGGACVTCHTNTAREVPGIGTAPPNPHLQTLGLSETVNCRQCHVFQNSTNEYVASTFVGLPQDLRRGSRLYPSAPPTIPHRLFMREDCASCHTGGAVRPEIRCSHPERLNCVQCHVRE